MNNKPTFQTCCNEVAADYQDEFILAHKVVQQAAQLYADRCVEEAVKPLRQALMDIMAEIELYKKAHPRTP